MTNPTNISLQEDIKNRLTKVDLQNLSEDGYHTPGSSTLSVHGGARRFNTYHALTEPIIQTATYTFKDTADLRNFMDARMWGLAEGRTEYGRYGNPTVESVEERLAVLEGAEKAILFSSGMAAITTILLAILSNGAHVVITDDCYRRTHQFCLTFLKRLGITCTITPMGDYQALEAAITPQTRLLISESPTNPYLRCLDLNQFADIGRRNRVKTLVDATFATPLNVRPLEWGIDLVVHSATKYLAGHNDLLAGVVAGEAGIIASLRQSLGVMGAVADPHSAALLLRGLKTLGLRISRQNENGRAVAEFLQNHPKVERVWYPGLKSHPDHRVAAQQMIGFGGVVSFSIKGDLDLTSRFIDSVRIPIIAASLGGVESLIEQPAIMSYYELSSEERNKVGISDNLVRLALGIEDTQDLIEDLDQALNNI